MAPWGKRNLLVGVVLACVPIGTGALTPALASATTLYVAAGGTDDGGANNCQDGAAPCATLEQAVKQSAAGDTIDIGPGEFHEAVETTTELHLVGAGDGADGTSLVSSGETVPGIWMKGGGSLEGFALSDDYPGIGGALQVDGEAVLAKGISVLTAPSGAGTDAVDVAAGLLRLEDSALSATNSDQSIENVPVSRPSEETPVINDASALEVSGGDVTIESSRLAAERGMALRVHGSAGTVRALNSVIVSSGAEDLTGAKSGADGWPAIEAAGSSPLVLIGDTVVNNTLGNSEEARPPADALLVERVAGDGAELSNTILRAQPGGNGADIDTWEPLTASFGSFTTLTLNNGASVTPNDTDGNISGDPDFAQSSGDFALASSSPLIGAGNAADTEGSVDVSGAPRVSECASGNVVNIGASESPAPTCEGPAPVAAPGEHGYFYVGHGSSFEQFMLGENELLGKLSPFEASAVHEVGGGVVSAFASPQVYALEDGVLQQYQIGGSGQLTPGTRLEPATGEQIDSAALGVNGSDLYLVIGDSGSYELVHERVSPGGAISEAGQPLTLPPGSTGAGVAVDDNGRVYVQATHANGSATLYDLRVGSDGRLEYESSLGIGLSGGLTIAPNGSEVVVTYRNGVLGSGRLYPFKVAAGGAFTAMPSVPSAVANPALQDDNNPYGVAFAPDSATFYVANDVEVGNGGGVELIGGMISPFAVKGNGELEALTPTPNPEAPGALPNEYEFDAGIAVSLSGKTLYAPNNYGAPRGTGSIEEFAIGTGGALTLKGSMASAPNEGSFALVNPPAEGKEENREVVLPLSPSPPPPPPSVTQPGIAGFVTSNTHAPIAGVEIYACPSGQTFTNACVSTSTNASGYYSLAVSPGTWLLQVNPPSTAFFPASVEVVVNVAEQTTQDFTLSPPRPLSKGVVFQTPGGEVSSGVPVVNWQTPFSFTAPAGAPKRQPGGRDILVAHVFGLRSNSTSSQGKSFSRAAVLMYGVHYDAAGHPSGMTNPLVAEVSCATACPSLAGSDSTTSGNAGVAIEHGKLVLSASNGGVIPLEVTHTYSPGLAPGANPLANVSVGLNSESESEDDRLAREVEEEEEQLEKDADENNSFARSIADGNDSVQVDVASLNATTHGGGQWFDIEDRGVDDPQISAKNPETFLADADETDLRDSEEENAELDALESIRDYLADKGQSPLSQEEETMYLQAFDGYVAANGRFSLTDVPSSDTEQGFKEYFDRIGGEVNALDLSEEDRELLYQSLAARAPALFPKTEQEREEDRRSEEEREDDEEHELEEEEAKKLEQQEREDERAEEDDELEQREREEDERDEREMRQEDDELERFEREEDDRQKQEEEDHWEQEWGEIEDEEGNVYWDPSGAVESTSHVPLADAVVVLTRSTKAKGPFEKLPNGSTLMSPANRKNPSRTSVAGLFGWETVPGYYRISASHPGCRSARTSAFAVPPPRSNLVLRLRCYALRRRTTRVQVHAGKGRHGTLVFKVTVKPRHGHAAAGTELGVIRVNEGHKVLAEVALSAHGSALVDLAARSASRLRFSYGGNGVYAPSSTRG